MFTSKTHKLILSVAPMVLALAGCFDEDGDDEDGDSVSAYVAVGNSLTSGFQSGGLREDWQRLSYPALIAQQMGGEDFQLPLIDSPGLGSTKIADRPATPLDLDPESRTIIPKPLTVPVTSLLLNRSLPRPYDNLGIPGATTLDFLQAYDSNTAQSKGNGYFNIVLRGGLFHNATMLRQAIFLRPKVMTVWIGNNDILGGVTSGRIEPGVNVTPTSVYSALMDRALDTLLRETDAHLFLANIPAITSIPFVTAVPRSLFDPATFQSADTSTRLLTEEDSVRYVLITALGPLLKKDGFPTALGGTGVPLPASVTLTEQEVLAANALVDGYNAYLKGKADANPARITLVDVKLLLEQVTNGQIPGLNGKFPLIDSANTVFSLDGIHPNSKGYRQVANLFLDAINGALGKQYPKLD